jgi:4-amino-4-deoxy-L-arabinose transferase-like glycosyltransferase
MEQAGAGEASLDGTPEVLGASPETNAFPDAGAESRRARLFRRARRLLIGDPGWARPGLLVIAAVAAVAYSWAITTDGMEAYYAASVRSMAGSWHDFLYGSFDAHGLISLDKLPGAFWPQALSVRVFGLSVWSMVLPQVVWSVLAVLVLFRTVRRIAGPAAGLAAAALLAVSPVTLTATRGNVAEPLFVLLLILAADAVIRAAATGRLRSLILAGVWVGLAFQAKMAEAWLILPALLLAYLVAAPAGRLGKARYLLAAAPVVIAVSLSWMIFVTATPAHDRPYVDGSSHNSVFEQVFLYNGVDRFGGSPAYGLGLPAKPSAEALDYSEAVDADALDLGTQIPRPGWDRLLSAPLVTDSGWLLPVALLVAAGALAVAVVSWSARTRRKDSTATNERTASSMRAGFTLWGLWLITLTAVFSASSIVRSYYFADLAPAIAALCALGLKFAADRFGAVRWRAALTGSLLAAAVWSAFVLGESGERWRGLAIALAATALVTSGAAALVAWAGRSRLAGSGAGRRYRAAVITLLSLTAAVILTGPVIADGWLLAYAGGPFDVPLLPAGTNAHPRLTVVPLPSYGGTVWGSVTAADWKEIQDLGPMYNSQLQYAPGRWIAVYASGASDLVLGGVQQVLPVGGFTGSAPFPTVAQMRSMIQRGQITLAIVPGPGDVRANDPRIRLIVASCTDLTSTGRLKNTGQALLYECGPVQFG